MTVCCLLSTNPSPPDDSIYVYEYEPDTDKTKGLVDVFLWEEASSISIHEDKLYLTLEESVFITDPYWCSFYGRVSVRILQQFQLSLILNLSFCTYYFFTKPFDWFDRVEIVLKLVHLQPVHLYYSLFLEMW